MAGLSAEYDGYRRFYADETGPSAAGFTGDQRFFLAFAQA
jgi:predicted metalloendopeptidase